MILIESFKGLKTLTSFLSSDKAKNTINDLASKISIVWLWCCFVLISPLLLFIDVSIIILKFSMNQFNKELDKLEKQDKRKRKGKKK